MRRLMTLIVSIAFAADAFAAVPGPGAGTPADSTAKESQFLTNVRALTYQGMRAGESYFSNDGRFLIFQSERQEDNPFYQIYILDLQTGETHRVSPGIGKTTCAFFRPGTDEVIFASTHADPEAVAKQKAEIEFRASGKQRRYSWDYDENYDIYSARRDGSDLTRLTKTRGYDAEGSYSPDGRSIVFCSFRDVYAQKTLSAEDQKRLEMDPAYFGEIYIMNADGSGTKRLTDWPGYDGGPFFSPDGQRIIWRHFDESGMLADIYTMRLDGSDRRRLTDFGSMSWAPFFHPSGKYVVFTSNKLGFSNFELYIVDTNGEKEPVRVTYTDGFDGLPVFSPDGTQLAWTSNRTASGKSQVFLASWNHAAALAALSDAPGQTAIARAPEKTSDRGRQGGDENSPDITARDLRADVDYLASDELEGRMTGSKGTQLASRFIIAQLKSIGLQPLGDNKGYTQTFPFTSGVELVKGKNTLAVIHSNEEGAKETFPVDGDFRPLAFSADGTVRGSVVFAGYGLKVPGGGPEGYDSYAGLDVKDKIVVVLRYVPEGVDVKRRQELNHYAGERYKAMVARENGAKALLIVTGPNSPNAGELMSLKFDQSLESSGIVVASITRKVADALFTASGKDLGAAQSGLDVENPHVEGTFDLPNVEVEISAAVSRTRKNDRNVIALLPPGDGVKDPEYVVVGAHYDHIGHGEIGSLAHKGEENQIHNGADDNASGTSTVLELAAWLADQRKSSPARFKRGVVFALWSGEELGIIGSSYYTAHPTVPLEKIAAYVNFDMVGRLRDNKLIVQGVGSSPKWTELIEKRNVAAGFNLILQDDPYLPTDVTSFYPKNIPVLSFFTGSHEDYNRPTDDAATLDYDGMVRIGRFAGSLITDLVEIDEAPAYAKVERSKDDTSARGALRAYLGTIPDYATEGIEGVKLSGVRADGPADKAGIQGGDVIVELAGQKITNIYDYTYALDAVKIGEPVVMVVLRGGKRLSLEVVPEARK